MRKELSKQMAEKITRWARGKHGSKKIKISLYSAVTEEVKSSWIALNERASQLRDAEQVERRVQKSMQEVGTRFLKMHITTSNGSGRLIFLADTEEGKLESGTRIELQRRESQLRQKMKGGMKNA